MAKAIIITGTPATGKTTLANIIVQRYNLPLISAKEFAIKHHLIQGTDTRRDSLIVDEKKWAKTLEKELASQAKNRIMLVEGLFSHFLSPKSTILCLVTNCSLKELKKRLTSRGYGDQKIRENLQAEAFNECHIEATELGHAPYALNPSNPADIAALYIKLDTLLQAPKAL